MDVGGTFTDCVPADGRRVDRPREDADDARRPVRRRARRSRRASPTPRAGERRRRCSRAPTSIVHGTTTGDNTMIQMSGAPTGLLVTAGLPRRDRDAPLLQGGHLGSRRTRRRADRAAPRPARDPRAADRRRRGRHPARRGRGARARRGACARSGSRRSRSCSCTRTSNPAHELRARELVLEEYPDVELVSLSHEVYPKPPEFERTSTTLVNAYVGPPIVRYLDRLDAPARATPATTASCSIATSAGGVATPDAIGRRAVATIGSGPTGGVVAAARAARAAGLGDVVSVDMGGTSYDVCLDPRRSSRAQERLELAAPLLHRAARWSTSTRSARAAARSRSCDGSALAVGPESAGSEPGRPATGAAARARRSPTPTSSSVASTPTRSGVGGCASTSTRRAARSSALGRRARRSTSRTTAVAVVAHRRRAHDRCGPPRALARGRRPAAARPRARSAAWARVHATTQAATLGMRRVLVPRAAPGFSALGLLTADHVVDDARTLPRATGATVDLDRLNALADDLERARTRRARRRRRAERPHAIRVDAQPRLSGPDVRQRASR